MRAIHPTNYDRVSVHGLFYLQATPQESSSLYLYTIADRYRRRYKRLREHRFHRVPRNWPGVYAVQLRLDDL